ncbi:hypothetical protein C3B59_03250 [Cryobacterium zongtaii]|uniref:DUF3558 domain-containing protein n=1 Tax=Cryobacterium zongtaii TaxID=1259217 RepID=A0A2S3ZP44_9MICO|nr:hypothetical protein [Cryobacterium zongtaii]POH70996.1 hypothetical protein C3B59_03250 [Cryobacterium zongtaii]
MGAATLPTGSPSRRPLWFALGAVGVLLVVALIVVLVVWRGGAGTPSGSDDSLPGTRPTPTATAEPQAVASAAPAVAAGPRPTSCEAIYSPAMLATLNETGTLNPEWAEKDVNSGVLFGTDDEQLIVLIEGAEHLTCVWGNPDGGSGSGLTSNVVFVTAEQSEAVHQRLLGDGLNCYEELGGIRCIAESTEGAEGIAGQSHFLRDGIWLATRYVNAGPDGYTHDMVATVWAGA